MSGSIHWWIHFLVKSLSGDDEVYASSACSNEDRHACMRKLQTCCILMTMYCTASTYNNSPRCSVLLLSNLGRCSGATSLPTRLCISFHFISSYQHIICGNRNMQSCSLNPPFDRTGFYLKILVNISITGKFMNNLAILQFYLERCDKWRKFWRTKIKFLYVFIKVLWIVTSLKHILYSKSLFFVS